MWTTPPSMRAWSDGRSPFTCGVWPVGRGSDQLDGVDAFDEVDRRDHVALGDRLPNARCSNENLLPHPAVTAASTFEGS